MASQYGSPWEKGFQSAIRILEAIDMIKKGLTNSEVAALYGVPSSTVSVWMRYCHETENFPESCDVPSLDRELFGWYLSRLKEGYFVTRKMIQLKARELYLKRWGEDNFLPGEGWIYRWKKRYGIIMRRKIKKSSQQLPAPPDPYIENRCNQFENWNECQSPKPIITQDLSTPQTSMNTSGSIVKGNKSSTFRNMVEKVLSQKGITGQQDSEDDDEIEKELDNMLSGFQNKVICVNKEIDEDYCNKNQDCDDILEPTPKMLATEEKVTKALLEHRFSGIVKDILCKTNRANNVGMTVEQEETHHGVTKIIDIEEDKEVEMSSEEDEPTDAERNISDEEEQTGDDVASEESSSAASVTESCDEKDEEDREYAGKSDDDKTNKNKTEEENSLSTENSLPISISDSEDEKKKKSGINPTCIPNTKERACTEISGSGEEPVLEIDSSSDDENDIEDDKNAKSENTGITNSLVSDSNESPIIVVDSSSGEDSDEENNNENKNGDDDDVILIENKSETIVIGTSDEEEEVEEEEKGAKEEQGAKEGKGAKEEQGAKEEKGEKSNLEEPRHQHSQFKIILLNTKDGGGDFSIVDPGSLETEPRVVVLDKE